MLHFIGFKGDEYHRARRIFGNPDFVHRLYDVRAGQEVVNGDIAVIANGATFRLQKPSFNDSEKF